MARSIKIPITSRYQQTKLFEQQYSEKDPSQGKFTFFGTWSIPEIPESDTDTFITAREGDMVRLDALAKEYYGNEALWWVIALVNEVYDPIYEATVAGKTLRIPDAGRVISVLFKGQVPTV